MKYISVPISKQAMARLDYDQHSSADVIEQVLSQSEIDTLFRTGFFATINEAASVNIDDFETESIVSETSIGLAINAAREHVMSYPDLVYSPKILFLLQEALRLKTGIFFSF